MKAVDCVYLYGEERDTTGISSRCGARSSSSSFSLSSSPYRSGSNKRRRTYPSLEDWAEQRIWYWFPWFPFLLSFPSSNKVWWKIGPILDALSALLVALLAIQDAQRSWNKERETRPGILQCNQFTPFSPNRFSPLNAFEIIAWSCVPYSVVWEADTYIDFYNILMLWYQGRETFRYPGVSTGKKKKTRQFNKWKRNKNWKLASDGWWPADDEEQEERTGDHHRRRFHDDCLFYLFILEFSPFNKWGFGVNKQIIHCEYQLMSTLCMENHEVAQCRRRTLILSRDSGGIKNERERERERELCKKRSLCRGALPGADWTTTATGIRCWPVSKLRGPALRKRLLPVYMRWAAKRGDFGTRTLVFISNRYNVESCWKFFFFF